MKKEPIFVAFTTQKGGAGKTTFTVLAASYFHFVMGYNVGIIDCDTSQHSSHRMRTRDLNRIRTDEHFKELSMRQLKETGIRAYPIADSSPDTAIDSARELIAGTDMEYDVIFFDFPGTINISGVLKTITNMDYLFVPISADRVVLESSMAFIGMVNDKLIKPKNYRVKGIYPFWNRTKSSAKTKLYQVYDEIIEELGVHRLEATIPESVKFSKELSDDNNGIFRSTFFPPDKRMLRGTNLEDLFEEIRSILNL